MWIYNYLCNQCLSRLKFVSSFPAHSEMYSIQHYMINVCQWLATCRWISLSSRTQVFFTNKTDYHDITEILLKVVLNIITLTPQCSTQSHELRPWNIVPLYQHYNKKRCTVYTRLKLSPGNLLFWFGKIPFIKGHNSGTAKGIIIKIGFDLLFCCM